MQNKKKVLIIEDDKKISKAYGEQLEKSGYEVEFLYSGLECCETAKKINPDLILLDILLPEDDGISIMKNLKSHEATSSIPIIIVSNLTRDYNDEEVRSAIEEGSEDYLLKAETSLDDMQEKVDEILNKNEK